MNRMQKKLSSLQSTGTTTADGDGGLSPSTCQNIETELPKVNDYIALAAPKIGLSGSYQCVAAWYACTHACGHSYRHSCEC